MKYLAVLIALTLIGGSFILLNSIYPFSPRLANATKNVSETVVDNWRGFLFDKNKEPVALDESPLDDRDIQDLIKSEVDRVVDLRLKEIMSQTAGGSSGLVVVPSSEATNTDKIAQSFSDEVKVYPDASGQSGVIVPIFRDGKGQSFLYILTPISQ